MNLKNTLVALLFVSSVQFLMLKMQVNRLANSTQKSAEKMFVFENRLQLLEKSDDSHILDMEESMAITTQEINKLRESNQYLLEHARQTDEKFEVMEQFRTRMETSTDMSI